MIRRSLCLIVLLSATLPVAAGTPHRIGNASSLMKDLTTGARVSVVLEYGRCQLLEGSDAQFAPPFAGGLVVDTWDARIGGSRGDESVIVNLTGESLVFQPSRGMLRRHVAIEVSHENRVAITLRYLDPTTNAVVSTWRLATTFDVGDDGAAAFYLLD